MCYSTMEREAAVARYSALHEDAPYHNGAFENWSTTWSTATPYHFTHGVSIVATPMDYAPDDDFLGRSALSDVVDEEPEHG